MLVDGRQVDFAHGVDLGPQRFAPAGRRFPVEILPDLRPFVFAQVGRIEPVFVFDRQHLFHVPGKFI